MCPSKGLGVENIVSIVVRRSQPSLRAVLLTPQCLPGFDPDCRSISNWGSANATCGDRKYSRCDRPFLLRRDTPTSFSCPPAGQPFRTLPESRRCSLCRPQCYKPRPAGGSGKTP